MYFELYAKRKIKVKADAKHEGVSLTGTGAALVADDFLTMPDGAAVADDLSLHFLKGVNMNLNYTPKEEIKSKNKC